MSSGADTTQSADICLESQLLHPKCPLETILNDCWEEFEQEYRYLLRKAAPVADGAQHKSDYNEKDDN